MPNYLSCLIVSVLLIIHIILNVHGLKPKRPSYFPTCYRNDPNLNQCLLDATEQVKPYLAKGVPELKLPPFEPFNIPEIKLETGTSALNFKAILKNIIAHGLTNYTFSRFDFDVPNLQFFCNAKIVSLKLEGDYSVSGRILVAPIEGGGKFTAQIESADVYVYQKYKEATLSDGKIHLVPTATNSSISVQQPKVHLEGLFAGNEDLNAATNKAINDNADALFQELRPVLEHIISKIMEDILFKSIISNMPWDELYPVNPNFD